MNRQVVVGSLGLLAGILAGIVVVLISPMTRPSGLPPLAPDRAPPRAYSWDDYRGIRLDARDLSGYGSRTTGREFADPALTHVRLGIITLPGVDGGPEAIAVKVSALYAGDSLWKARLGTIDYWNIFWPGEGAVFATGYSNYWSLLRDKIWATVRGGGHRLLAAEYPVSVEPPAWKITGVTGSAGRYAGFGGDYRESLFPAATGEPEWTLSLKLNPPPLPAR